MNARNKKTGLDIERVVCRAEGAVDCPVGDIETYHDGTCQLVPGGNDVALGDYCIAWLVDTDGNTCDEEDVEFYEQEVKE